MANDPDFTGERFLPGVRGEIVYEHVHRYAVARAIAGGLRVLDAACGEGYGSALIAQTARHVTGIDLDAATVGAARKRYGARSNLEFRAGSVAALPLADASVDLVVSFETVEHLPARDQPRMIAEFARVLTPAGALLISSPNRSEYSEAREYVNPFHLHELDRAELEALLAGAFPAQRWYRQRMWLGSTLWSEDATDALASWNGDADRVDTAAPPAAMYYVVAAARATEALPRSIPGLSLFSDPGESERKRSEAQATEVLRLDALLRERDAELERRSAHVGHLEALVAERERLIVERDAALDARAAHVAHLEALVAERERLVVERDAALAARDTNIARLEAGIAEHEQTIAKANRTLARTMEEHAAAVQGYTAECGRLERAIAAQERIIAYRQSARWWIKLPWMRMRLWLDRLRLT